MIFRTCEYCEAHLDPGETCSCQEEEAPVERHCCVTAAAPHINIPHNAQKGGEIRCH